MMNRRVWKRIPWLRLALGALMVCLTAWALLPLTWHVCHIGVVIPAVVGVMGLLACVFVRQVRDGLRALCKRRWGRAMLGVALLLVVVVLVLFLIASVYMLHAAAAPPPSDATVIVLGAAIYGDRPSPMLADRLNAAARYLEENPDAVCIVSGGQGGDEDYPESEIMYRYLVDQGIDPARLYQEDASANTYENITFSLRLREREGLPAAIVIATQEFHQYRAQSMVRAAGATEVGACTCRSPQSLLLCYWVRECAAVCRLWALGY
jgi:uncharacterized SAM-binding protein YcdF (DUF218 family)